MITKPIKHATPKFRKRRNQRFSEIMSYKVASEIKSRIGPIKDINCYKTNVLANGA